MSLLKYPNLYSPIVLGNTLFKNRIFAFSHRLPKTSTVMVISTKVPLLITREKARGGAASVATFEGVWWTVNWEKGGATHICLDTPQIDRGLSRIAQAVKKLWIRRIS